MPARRRRKGEVCEIPPEAVGGREAVGQAPGASCCIFLLALDGPRATTGAAEATTAALRPRCSQSARGTRQSPSELDLATIIYRLSNFAPLRFKMRTRRLSFVISCSTRCFRSFRICFVLLAHCSFGGGGNTFFENSERPRGRPREWGSFFTGAVRAAYALTTS